MIPLDRTLILLRVGCFFFGIAVGLLLPDGILHRFHHHARGKAEGLLYLVFYVAKMVVCCAVAVLVAPLPVPLSVLYAGAGLLVSHTGKTTYTVRQGLPLVCTWLILYLPFTGALACLGGVLLVLAADVPGLSALAVLILAAPMALLQFGAEGGLVLLGTAFLLCLRQTTAFFFAVHHTQ